MTELPRKWEPIGIGEIQTLCGDFEDWVLCGGHSVALLTGEDRRAHGDVDIGVFRSQAAECLTAIGKDQIFLCVEGRLVPWDGGKIPQAVHDIWISDEQKKNWIMQVMLYDDDKDRVYYRRNRAISWPKASHALQVGSIKVLNPYITFLFKAHKSKLEPKEISDLIQLIEAGAKAEGCEDACK